MNLAATTAPPPGAPQRVLPVALNGATRVVAGAGSFRGAVRLRSRRAVAVVDRRLPEEASLRELLAEHGVPVRGHDGAVTTQAVADLGRWLAQVPGDVTEVLAIGGGSTIDAVKVAVLAGPALPELVPAGAGPGLVKLPVLPPARLRLTAVPTTVGTSAEVSSVACVDAAPGRRALLMSPQLAPAHAVLDPALVRTLPLWLAREGTFEALMRVLGPEVGVASSVGVAQDEAHFLAAALSRRLERLAGCAPDGAGPVAHEVACLGLMTQRGWAMTGRGPYPHPLWYVANELAVLAGLRKMQATALLFPAWVGRVGAGDERWGDAGRLARAWPLVAGAAARADGAVPDARLAETLLASWRIDLPATAELGQPLMTAVARQCHARWGGRLPMLSRFTVADLESLLQEAAARPACAAGAGSG